GIAKSRRMACAGQGGKQILRTGLDGADVLFESSDSLTGLLLEEPTITLGKNTVVIVDCRWSAAQQIQIRTEARSIRPAGRWGVVSYPLRRTHHHRRRLDTWQVQNSSSPGGG